MGPWVWVDQSIAEPPVKHDRFHFTAKFLDAYESETTIILDEYCRGVVGDDGDLILQRDIEGAEYRVIAAASKQVLHWFRIMVIEFPHLYRLCSRTALPEIRSVFGKLLKNHRVVHIHPSNYAGSLVMKGDLEIPSVLEFTLYRADRDRFEPRPLKFPHPFDAPNNPDFPVLALPHCWQPKS